ncbi:hypothetical protein DFJ58DRAFT_849572 [Suillus subalutaceus]|uniref:uncharacterized protein n=1 Tax=Suillus subalutaceus TaxID=48586 RepID=UPI001B871463|nr:uncharacterized protein DFJ58DRAFT_849572 [Suillus subalutaceus]KAG1825322.1 hypothetical protein DFJ58DRAFT_849572 [Suillus subalutaceus]
MVEPEFPEKIAFLRYTRAVLGFFKLGNRLVMVPEYLEIITGDIWWSRCQPLPNAFELYGVDFPVSHDSAGLDQSGNLRIIQVKLLEINSDPPIQLTARRLHRILEDLFVAIEQIAVLFRQEVGCVPSMEVPVVPRHLRICLDAQIRGSGANGCGMDHAAERSSFMLMLEVEGILWISRTARHATDLLLWSDVPHGPQGIAKEQMHPYGGDIRISYHVKEVHKDYNAWTYAIMHYHNCEPLLYKINFPVHQLTIWRGAKLCTTNDIESVLITPLPTIGTDTILAIHNQVPLVVTRSDIVRIPSTGSGMNVPIRPTCIQCDPEPAFSSILEDMIIAEYEPSTDVLDIDDECDPIMRVVNIRTRRRMQILTNGLHQILAEAFDMIANPDYASDGNLTSNEDIGESHHDSIQSQRQKRRALLNQALDEARWTSRTVWRIIGLARALRIEAQTVTMECGALGDDESHRERKTYVRQQMKAITDKANKIMVKIAAVPKKSRPALQPKEEDQLYIMNGSLIDDGSSLYPFITDSVTNTSHSTFHALPDGQHEYLFNQAIYTL